MQFSNIFGCLLYLYTVDALDKTYSKFSIENVERGAELRVRSVNPWNFTVEFLSMDFCSSMGNKSMDLFNRIFIIIRFRIPDHGNFNF